MAVIAPEQTEAPAAPDRLRPACAGAVAAGLALAVTEALAGLLRGVPPLVTVIGEAFIRIVPGSIERFAIGLLGTADKPALLIGIVVVALLAGAALGLAARTRFAVAVAGFAAFGLLGVVAAGLDPRYSAWLALPSAVLGAAAGLYALQRLLHWSRRAARRDGDEQAAETVQARARRDFLRILGGYAVAAVALGAFGRRLASRAVAVASRDAVDLRPAVEPAPPAPAGATVDVEGVTPLYTPNADFYRIDTALMVPQVDVANWQMRVTGMVERELTLNYAQLLAEPLVEADITIACVSNEVGGNLIGNARWLGIPLQRILDRAGVHPEATQIVGRSVDGFTAGFPTEVAFDGRDTLLAIAMNGEPLPLEHGFPARLIVPGLYGYVSATKWLAEIELTTWEAFDGYWIPRGWSKEGPVKTQSRIDVPRSRATVAAGTVAVAGVAWAQQRGIERVEVRVDDADWQQAELAQPVNVDTWRQWVYRWDAVPGRHTLAVRATDATGEAQTATPSGVAPDGATGHHTIEVNVA